MVLVLLIVVVLAGCAGLETYPPAVPAHTPSPPPGTLRVGWEKPPISCYVPGPPLPELATIRRVSLQPPRGEEWQLWHLKVAGKVVCRGKGKGRTCREVVPNAVDEANQGALVKPTPFNTALGQSALVRFEIDPRVSRVYEVPLSPLETTLLAFPEGERLAHELLIDETRWEVKPGKVGAEETRREVIAVRPLFAPMVGRGVVALRSGAQIVLKLVAQERPGAISVLWDYKATALAPPPPTPDQVPPTFDMARAYESYTTQLVEGKYPPAWMPEGILDDGKNTLIKFPGLLEGIQTPVAKAILPNGSPAQVQTRLYVRREHGAWMYLQGLHPALILKDAAGTSVKIVRTPPQPQGGSDVY